MNPYDHIIKYPRTPHIEGSRLQPGDEDLSQIPFAEVAGRHLVVEEKIDGANSGVSFGEDGQLLLQSRGHFLTGGYRERHYELMKDWARVHQAALYGALGSRYIMYGEWMYAKHSIFYDALPHYFMEFDVYDRETGRFLDTPSRRALLEGLPVCSVPVLRTGVFRKKEELLAMLGPSNYITERHIEKLRAYAEQSGLDADRQCRETDPSTTMEGLYIKVEEGGEVTRRVKFVRASFLQCVEESQTHWLNRPIVPNQLVRPTAELFKP
ncbi:MAG: RNA ligase family protein [Clostridia bacterium]|nr:RNA ligase family protein [Clostridia bacterium]